MVLTGDGYPTCVQVFDWMVCSVVPKFHFVCLRATGERWEVTRGEGDAMPSLRELAQAVREAEDKAMRATGMLWFCWLKFRLLISWRLKPKASVKSCALR